MSAVNCVGVAVNDRLPGKPYGYSMATQLCVGGLFNSSG